MSFNNSSRPLSETSVSISGIEIRSGFKNLSNSKLYLSGFNSVIPKLHATIEPAADPLPGPIGIPRERAL